MIDVNTLPPLPRVIQRPTFVPVTDESIHGQFVDSAGQFSMHVGDVIEFNLSQDNGDPVVKSQTLVDGLTRNYIACTRNGRPSWIYEGSLARLDSQMNPVDDFAKGYRDRILQSNFTIMYKEYLSGKTITALSEHKVTFNKFNADGTEERSVPVITFKA